MKRLICLIILVTVTVGICFADESVTIYGGASKSQDFRLDWFESLGERWSTYGFADHYPDNTVYGEARLSYQFNTNLMAGSELRLMSWRSSDLYVGPQLKLKIGEGFTRISYWMKPGSQPDIGTYTFIPLGKKVWFDMTLDYNFQKITLLEPQFGYKLSDDFSLTVQYRGGSIWTQPETAIGLQYKF